MKANRNKRAIASVAVFILFIPLIVSAGMLPEEEAHVWTVIHVVCGTIFMIFAIFHLVYNWKLFRSYLSRGTNRKISNKRAVASVGLFILFSLLIVSAIMLPEEETHVWTLIHGIVGRIFMIFVIFHLVYNWKLFRSYLGRKKLSRNYLNKKKIFRSYLNRKDK
jgi:succinate dehydrogenase/fumarate reductase cytochrome b subunit